MICPLQPETRSSVIRVRQSAAGWPKEKAAPSCRTRAAKGLKGVQVISESSAKALAPKDKKRTPNVDLLLAKLLRQTADAGYRLTIEPVEKGAPPATIPPLEEWKRSREG